MSPINTLQILLQLPNKKHVVDPSGLMHFCLKEKSIFMKLPENLFRF